jgi:hypothetical protein
MKYILGTWNAKKGYPSKNISVSFIQNKANFFEEFGKEKKNNQRRREETDGMGKEGRGLEKRKEEKKLTQYREMFV